MKKLFQVKFILFIFLSFFVFDIKISSAQLIDQPCSNFAGAVCVLNPNVFQYEIMQNSVCPDVSQRCVKKLPDCTGECKPSSNCPHPIGGFCDGTMNTSCCGGNMTSQQQTNIETALQNKSLCPVGEIYLEVPILASKKCVKDLSDYIRILFNYGIYAASVMAVIMISINGFKWVAAGGNQSTIGKAKSGVFTAIIGLFLLFGSYMILNTVNSQLTLLQMPYIEPITADPLDSTFKIDEKSMAYWEEMTNVADQNKLCTTNADCAAIDKRWSCIRLRCRLRSPELSYCDNKDNDDCYPYLSCVSNKCYNIPCKGKSAWSSCETVGGISLSVVLVQGYCNPSRIVPSTNIHLCTPCVGGRGPCTENEQCKGAQGVCGNGGSYPHGDCYTMAEAGFYTSLYRTCKKTGS